MGKNLIKLIKKEYVSLGNSFYLYLIVYLYTSGNHNVFFILLKLRIRQKLHLSVSFYKEIVYLHTLPAPGKTSSHRECGLFFLYFSVIQLAFS